jgi:hypothetical protein
MATEYVIPDAVMDQIAGLFTPMDSALAAQAGAWEVTELVERIVRAAARLIVAAELERLVDETLFEESPAVVRDRFRRRASELRGEA